MASKLAVLLALALIACAVAAPATTERTVETTTNAEQDGPVYEIVELEEELPVEVDLVEITTTSEPEKAAAPAHKIVKRSALRGDNPSNDLLANYDSLVFGGSEFSFDGRRIKTLPSWVG